MLLANPWIGEKSEAVITASLEGAGGFLFRLPVGVAGRVLLRL